ncbi:urease accessory protein UreE [Helicobacter cetorum]|uniref:Urease accessory protein UreE n=1 Tax=Helicobacter cetorum (strain ATCC BAA-540 / CCUG 52418 / MIT 99-5656) TaxID=1163745 RepID=I0ES16_HELCM|nr:urease accessory protein UreE [Helicobacter cetorum]AFI05735.1 urease accessory protein UreE [Helicobacter cetorum MIT 99-5656]
MIIERLSGNLRDLNPLDFNVDYVNLEWFETRKKIARFKTEQAKDIAIRLKDAPKLGLSHGDILFKEGKDIIAINILASQVIHIEAKSVAEVAKICYEIGNRHAALYYGENPFEFKTPFDKPMLALLEKLGIQNRVLSSRLDSKERLTVSMAHSEPNFKVSLASDFKIVMK